MKKYLKIVLYSIVFLILLAELILRIGFNEKLKIRHYPLIYRPDSLLGYTYIPNAESQISVPGIEKKIKINENGYYGPSFKKNKERKTRIAIIANSEATGLWLNSDSSFSVILQEMLNKNGFDAEVINFAVDGRMRDVNNAHLVRTEVVKYKPDLVLLSTGMPFIQGSYERDIYKDFMIIYNGRNVRSKEWCKTKIDYITDHSFLSGLYDLSYIVRAFCRRYMNSHKNKNAFNLEVFVKKRIQAPDIKLLPYSINKSVKLLTAAKDTLFSYGGKLIVFDYEPDSKKKEILDKYGIANLFLNIPDEEDLTHKDDGHYNENGQTEIARQLFDILVSQKYVVQ
jgi:hypothetical protein